MDRRYFVVAVLALPAAARLELVGNYSSDDDWMRWENLVRVVYTSSTREWVIYDRTRQPEPDDPHTITVDYKDITDAAKAV